MDNLGFQIGRELGELRHRLEQLEEKCTGRRGPCGCHGKRRLTKQQVTKLQNWIRQVDAYRRLAEGEDVPGLALVPGYTAAQIACIASLTLLLCGAEVLACGGPEDIPCIIAACGETWPEIVEMCGL